MRRENLLQQKIELVNAGNLSLFFIGCGSAFSKKHNQNNLLVIKGDQHLLIDCGTKCPQALHSVGIPSFGIKNYLITHSHADHIGGLEEAVLMGRYVAGERPNIIITPEYQKLLWRYSLMGGAAFNEKGFAEPLEFEDFFSVLRPQNISGYPRDTYHYRLGDIDLKMMRTLHIPNVAESWHGAVWSTGVVIDERVLFTSDTLYDYDLVKDYDDLFDFEAIFHDCQFFTGGVHASLAELKQFPEKIRRKMYLMHYGDNWTDYVPEIEQWGFAGLTEQMVYYHFD